MYFSGGQKTHDHSDTSSSLNWPGHVVSPAKGLAIRNGTTHRAQHATHTVHTCTTDGGVWKKKKKPRSVDENA